MDSAPRTGLLPRSPAPDRSLSAGKVHGAGLNSQRACDEVVESGDSPSSESKEPLELDRRHGPARVSSTPASCSPCFGSAETEQGDRGCSVMMAVRDERAESAFDLDDIDPVPPAWPPRRPAPSRPASVFERVKERDRLAAIGEMSAGLAHEIRNPLGAIKGAAQLLVGPDGQPHRAVARVGRVPPASSSRRSIASTTWSVSSSSYARVEKSDPKEHGELWTSTRWWPRKPCSCWRTTRAPPKISHRDPARRSRCPRWPAIPEQLRQVFLNLGINALQAIGRSRRQARDHHHPAAALAPRLRLLRRGSLSRQRGQGIPRGQARRSCSFPSTPPKSGAPAWAWRSATASSVNTEAPSRCRSNPGKGSTFSVFLPALGPSLPSRPEPESRVRIQIQAP